MAPEREHGRKGQITADSQAERIFAWRRGFNAMYLIDLGVRLGLFRTLAETPELSVRQLAEKLDGRVPIGVEKEVAHSSGGKLTTNGPPARAATGGMRHGRGYQEVPGGA